MVIEFVNYMIIWWDYIVTSRRSNNERPIDKCNDLGFDDMYASLPSLKYRPHFPLPCLMDGVCNFVDKFSWSFNFLTHSDFVSVINVLDCLFCITT
jgi:hypothetical protein